MVLLCSALVGWHDLPDQSGEASWFSWALRGMRACAGVRDAMWELETALVLGVSVMGIPVLHCRAELRGGCQAAMPQVKMAGVEA